LRSLASNSCCAAALAALLIALPLHSSAQGIEKLDVKFSLGWVFVASQAMFTYGVEQGYFKAEGLNVTVDRGAGSGASIQRVANGSYDMAYTDLGSLAKYNAENPGQQLIAVYIVEDESPLALFALEGKGISKPKDVEGKRIAASQFDGARQVFPALARANNIDTGKITWKIVDPQLREAMLVRGEVDAITGFTTTSVILLQSLNQKFVTLRYDEFSVSGFGNSVITSPEFLHKNPNTVSAFLRALNRSIKGMIENPGAAVNSLRARDAVVDLGVESRRLDLMVTQLILTPSVVKNGLSSADPTRLAKAIENVVQSLDGKPSLAVGEVYTPDFLPPAEERKAPDYKR
jgi:NitT/TauT family transport system substrate-binding protein